MYENYRCIHDFVAEALETPLPFVLYEAGASGSTRLETRDYDTRLVEMSLVPSALLTFAWHPEVAAEVQQQMQPGQPFLKAEYMALASEQ